MLIGIIVVAAWCAGAACGVRSEDVDTPARLSQFNRIIAVRVLF